MALNTVKKDEPVTPRLSLPKKEPLTPATQSLSRATVEYTPTLPNKRVAQSEPADSSDLDENIIIKKKKKKSTAEEVQPVSASTRVLRDRPVKAPPHRCYVEIPPHPLHRRNKERLTNVQASSGSAEVTSSSMATGNGSATAVKFGPPKNRAVGAVRPETYFWPVATVMRRKVQEFIEHQRDALTALDAELLVAHQEHAAELKKLRQEVLMRQKLHDFIDAQRVALTAMNTELLTLHREHEAEQRKLRREVLGLD